MKDWLTCLPILTKPKRQNKFGHCDNDHITLWDPVGLEKYGDKQHIPHTSQDKDKGHLDKDHLDKGHLVKGHLVTIYTNKESPISMACLLCYSNIVLVI